MGSGFYLIVSDRGHIWFLALLVAGAYCVGCSEPSQRPLPGIATATRSSLLCVFLPHIVKFLLISIILFVKRDDFTIRLSCNFSVQRQKSANEKSRFNECKNLHVFHIEQIFLRTSLAQSLL